MSKVEWIENDSIHELHFEPFYDDEIIAELSMGNDGNWYYSSEWLGKTDEPTFSDIENSKAYIENAIEEHWYSLLEYYNALIKSFKEREQND